MAKIIFYFAGQAQFLPYYYRVSFRIQLN